MQRPQPGRGVAVVTGGTAGVGRATVRELAARGWDVGVLARGEAGLRATEADVTAAGRRSLGISTDVADLGAVQAAATRIESELGPIDLWVNVAFVGALRTFWDTDPETYRRITEVTYFGQVHGCRVALERMRPRNRGVIVNVSSALAYRGIPLQSAYCGAKHAIKGFTESLITELRHERSKVRVCLATLPGLNTPQFDWNDNGLDGHPRPVAPVFQPEVAARTICFLAEHPRRNAWVGVSSAYTVLGNRFAPALLDRYLARTGFNGQIIDSGPRHGSNVFVARDEDADRGAHGMFDEESHDRDPWSATSMAVWGALDRMAGRAREVARRS
jgi:NAD(P)-dependent dehydrogenase (short-subunit alcohol dehydrogenase family)